MSVQRNTLFSGSNSQVLVKTTQMVTFEGVTREWPCLFIILGPEQGGKREESCVGVESNGVSFLSALIMKQCQSIRTGRGIGVSHLEQVPQ